jgi:hypothetical protein
MILVAWILAMESPKVAVRSSDDSSSSSQDYQFGLSGYTPQQDQVITDSWLLGARLVWNIAYNPLFVFMISFVNCLMALPAPMPFWRVKTAFALFLVAIMAPCLGFVAR